MKYLEIHKDQNGHVRRIRVLHDMGAKPSIVWNRDDDYDKPKFRLGWLPWIRLAFYPGLRGPIQYTIIGHRGEVESWREYRRRLGLRLAGIDRDRLERIVRAHPAGIIDGKGE